MYFLHWEKELKKQNIKEVKIFVTAAVGTIAGYFLICLLFVS